MLIFEPGTAWWEATMCNTAPLIRSGFIAEAFIDLGLCLPLTISNKQYEIIN